MKKQLLLLFFLLFGAFSGMMAQQKDHNNFSPKQFREELEKYIVLHAGLTPLDAKNFFPLFHELHEKRRQINREIIHLKRMQGKEQLSDKECREHIMRIAALKVESAELEQVYYKKMCKVVSPKKVLGALTAEDKFHRRMLRNLPHGKRFMNHNPPYCSYK